MIDEHLVHWQQIVTKWGISPETASHYALRYNGRGGLVYPTLPDSRYRVLLLQPARDRNMPKNFWDTDTAHLPMPALFNIPALDLPESKQLVYITNGEKSTMALHTAGLMNAVNTFGENIGIDRAVTILREHHNPALYLAPDCDRTGLMTARKWQQQAQEAGISIDLRDLRLYFAQQFGLTPDSYKGYDLRDLWLLNGQNRQVFYEALVSLPPLDFDRYRDELPTSKPRKSNRSAAHRIPDSNLTPAYENWRAEVVAALDRHSPAPDRGYHRHCPNPHHADRHPSFRITEQGAPVCTCEPSISWDMLAGWLGVPTWEAYKANLREQQKVEQKKKPSGQPVKATKKRIEDYIDPFDLADFRTDIEVNLPYISDIDLSLIPDSGAVIIKSPLGTGKTELIRRLIAHRKAQHGREPRVLLLTHRQALALVSAIRLELACYLGMDKKSLSAAAQLSICYNSIARLMKLGEALQTFDMVIVDEFEQFQQHLGGATFRNGDAKIAYQVFRQFARTATQFIALDADASDISVKWVEQVMGSVTTINNAYRPRRGKLSLHRDRARVVARALKLAQDSNTPVLVPVSSLAAAKRLERYFGGKLGADAVMMICSENAEDSPQQHFVHHINEELSKYKILIYTPSLGTGIDITAPVRAVCAVFSGTHMPATELKQMIGRARNAQEVHAYVQPVQYGSHETDAEVLRQQYINQTDRTGLECGFDAHDIWSVTPMQDEILRMLCAHQAEANRSRNDLTSHFVALMEDEGYRIQYLNGKDTKTGQAVKSADEAVKEQEKKAVLHAEPVSHAQIRDFRAEGRAITPEIRAGHQRFKIEDCVGQTITDEIYDDLHDRGDREKLRFFTSLYFDDGFLRQADREQAREDHLLTRRRHFTRRKQLVLGLLHAVWNIDRIGDLIGVCEERINGDEIDARTTAYLESHRHDLYLYFGWRSHYSPEPIEILRRILGEIGLKLDSQRCRVDGERVRLYAPDRQWLSKMQIYAESRKRSLLLKMQSRGETPNTPTELPPLSQIRHKDMYTAENGTLNAGQSPQSADQNRANLSQNASSSTASKRTNVDETPEVSQIRHKVMYIAENGTSELEWAIYAPIFVAECMEALDGESGDKARLYLLVRGITRREIDLQRLGYLAVPQFIDRHGEKIWLPEGIIRPVYREDCLIEITITPLSPGQSEVRIPVD